MMGRAPFLRNGNSRLENSGSNAMAMFGNLCFSVVVLAVLVLTVLAVNYQPDGHLFRPSDMITTFFTSTSDAMFKSDNTVKTLEDQVILDSDGTEDSDVSSGCEGEVDKPIDCRDPEVFHMMMTAAIEKFKDIHFYRFGKPVRGSDDRSCDMAWRFKPNEGKVTILNKDYRRFVISRSENCSLSVDSIGEYHSGVNARKRKKKGLESEAGTPVVEEIVNDTLPVVDSEKSFKRGKYLVYTGGGDRCKSMKHYLWSFFCALGEAQYLNRTFVMDMSICLSSIYTKSGVDEEGKDFRFYFDFQHLKESVSVLDEPQFWNKWQRENKLSLHLVEDFRITPLKLKNVKDSLIMRRFGTVEPDNYWYRVCEGDAESVIQKPWHLLKKSRRLMEVVSAIAARLNGDYDSVHIVRGEKAKNKESWPNLDRDTSPDSLLSTLRNKIDKGKHLYIATDEPDKSFFDPLKGEYTIHFLDDYKDLWDENSEWHSDTSKLNSGAPAEFDSYMRTSVDAEVFLRGKKQLETFNDLAANCKDGIDTCSTNTSS
ncbi:hypothetical protein AKJ16_DCAP03737 [Drosera capensis]